MHLSLVLTLALSGADVLQPVAFADTAPQLQEQSATTPEAVPPSRLAAYIASSIGVIAVTGAAPIAASIAVGGARFTAIGRPEPWLSSVLFTSGLAIHMLAVHFLLPLLARLADQPPWLGRADVARDLTWKTTRWAAGGAALGSVLYVVGSVLETNTFGRGQGLMGAGIVTMLASAIIFDVLESSGIWRHFVASRGKR